MGFWDSIMGTDYEKYKIIDPNTGEDKTQALENAYNFQEFASPESAVQTAVATVKTNLQNGISRISETFKDTFAPQGESWNPFVKVGNFVESTLMKVIVLVVILSIGYLFLLSFIQAKAVKSA